MTADEMMALIRASGKPHYVYLLRRPNGEPFYVGVGSGRRIRFHERVSASRRQEAKYAVMQEIVEAGGAIGYELVRFFDNWDEAAAEERRLIALYGRVDIGAGILANRTNGGQGIAGIKWHLSEARKDGQRRAAEKHRGRRHSEEHKAKIGAAHKGRKYSAESLAKMSASQKGRKATPEQRAKMSEAAKKRPVSPLAYEKLAEWRKVNGWQVAEANRERWQDPAFRERMSVVLKAAKRDFSFRRDPAYREAQAQRTREKWKDPEFRERNSRAIRSAKRKQRELQLLGDRNAVSDPE